MIKPLASAFMAFALVACSTINPYTGEKKPHMS